MAHNTMEFLPSFLVACISVCLLFVYYLVWKPRSAQTQASIRKAPEAAGAWPIIGHLHLVGGSKLLHIILGSMADQFGPFFTFKLGMKPAIVVSGWELAKECLTTHDRIFATRPKSVANHQIPGYDADTIIKSMCLLVLGGGTNTTSITLTWALSLLLNNPHALKKAQEELDLHVGRDRRVEESDIKKLVYLQAIVKETLRLYPAAPLSAPHESMEDCTLGGYHVPKGTRLVVNLWKIQRDPRVWADPCEFKPERFLTSHKGVDVRGQDFELLPFGSGRRMCPGMNMALAVTPLTLASLLHGFEVTTVLNEAVDMSESFGLTNLKATPLEVLVTPRLSSNLYG